jgi:L-ascorbate metabolism protein UlaG (beta-lactamase superfamily)
MKFLLAFAVIVACYASPAIAEEPYTTDVFETSSGDLEIKFIGHGSLMMKFDSKTIYIDPFGRLADYSKLPDADVVFITHHHGDHLDPNALKEIGADGTTIVCTEKCAEKVEDCVVVPAYNLVHKRDNGDVYHPKGEGNGYVLTFGGTRVYIGGDTENTPEMKALENIDVAFLPMNLPYTMTPEMVADAVNAFKPKVLYPYHYGKTDTSRLGELLKDNKDVEIRIRKM